MNKSLFFCISFFFFSSILFAQNGWEVLNPEPSFRTPVDMYFVDNNRGYIINRREILETLDAGESWQKKRDIYHGNDFDFNGNVAYIVGADGYVLRSVDAGNNWSQIQTGFNNDLLSVSVVDENTTYISGRSIMGGNNSVLLKTEDGGTNWELIDFPSNIAVNSVVFTSNLIGHAACIDGKLLKTIDGGNTWFPTEQGNSLKDFKKLHFVSNNVGFTTQEDRGLYKTTDGGNTWSHLGGNFSIYSIHFLNENIGFTCGYDGIIQKTIDGGLNWENISYMHMAYFSDFMAIYFTDTNRGFIGGERGRIAKTTNGGNTWNSYGFNYEDARQIDFIDSQIGYVLMDDKIFKTSDGGNNWVDTELPITDWYPSNFDFVNENIGYATNHRSFVYKTYDGGQNWDLITGAGGINLSVEGTYDVKFINENVGFVSGGRNYPRTFKTTNGGQSWVVVGNFRIYDIQFITEQLGYARDNAYSSSKLYKTIDGGNTWTILYEPNEAINSHHFINEDIGFLVGYNGMLEKTIDGGNNWTQLNIPHAAYDNVQFYSESIGFVVDDYENIYKTIDGGENWEEVLVGEWPQGASITMFDMQFTNDVLYMAGSWGKIIKYDLGILGTNKFNIASSEVSIYPNPSDEFILLESKNKKYLKSIEFFDISGRSVKKLPISKNSETLKISTVEFTLGLYLLKIGFTDETSTTKKIIIN
ncbi:MAG: YCF48-related protein [Aequorivita sp.]